MEMCCSVCKSCQDHPGSCYTFSAVQRPGDFNFILYDIVQQVFIVALMDVNRRFIKSLCYSERNSQDLNALEQGVCYLLPSARKISAGRVGDARNSAELHHFEGVSDTSSLHTKECVIASFCLRLSRGATQPSVAHCPMGSHSTVLYSGTCLRIKPII